MGCQEVNASETIEASTKLMMSQTLSGQFPLDLGESGALQHVRAQGVDEGGQREASITVAMRRALRREKHAGQHPHRMITMFARPEWPRWLDARGDEQSWR